MKIIKILLIILVIFGCSDKTKKRMKSVNEIGLKERKGFLKPTFRFPSSIEERCDGSKGYWHSNKTKSGTIEGGFVADSAYVGESVFLGKTVSVCENANVDGETRITGDVVVTENATIIGRVKIKGKVLIDGNVTISDDVVINGNPIHITGNSIIRDQAKIIDKANISGDAIIKERAVIKENAKISGDAIIEGDIVIEKDLSIDSGKYFLPTITPSTLATKISKMFQEKSLLEATRKRDEAIAEVLENERIAKLEGERKEALEKERIAKLLIKKNEALEKERIANLEREIEREKKEALEKERIAKLLIKKNEALEKERIANLEREKNEAIEKERIAKLEKEKNEALEKERIARLEREKYEAIEKERQKLEDEKKHWERMLLYFEEFNETGNFKELFGNLGWTINSSESNEDPIFNNNYDTKDHYLIEESEHFSKKGCERFEKCNLIKIEISTPGECKVSINFQSFDKKNFFGLNGTIDFSGDIREMKIVEKMGWSKNPQDDKFKSFGIFFKNPIPFEKLFAWGPWLNRESKNSKINLKEFHFPIFELDDLKSKTIIQGLQTLSKYCQKKLLKMAEVKKEINRIVEIEKPDSKKTEVSILDTKEIIRQALMEWDNNENADATIKLFKLACEEGRDSDACLNLGGFIKDIQKDFPDSIQWFRKGCELGDEDCCIIADSFTKSLKDPKDSKKMIDIKNLGNQYRNTGNILEAERMFRIACDVGMNSDACWNLAELRRKWFKDIEGAKEWYIMACELGDKDACKEKNKDLEKEGIAKLEKEKNEDLEKERIAKLESEKNAALEKDRIAKLEREKNEVAEKERQKLEDEKKLWEKALKSFEKFYTTPDYSQVDFSVKSSDLVWAINSSNENGPIFAKAYVTKDHYLIGKDSNLKKMVCDQSDQCNPIRILIDFSKTCKADIIFQSWDAFSPNNKQQIWMKGTIDFSKDVREMKIVEKMGWSKNPKDDKFKSLGIFFKNPIPFENRFYKDGSNGEVIKSTINLTEFHFPIFDLDDLKSKTIIEGFKYVRNFCVYF